MKFRLLYTLLPAAAWKVLVSSQRSYPCGIGRDGLPDSECIV